MKENIITLHPDTEWEREVLKKLRTREISRIQWEDDWDQRGGLMLVSPDRNDWGR
jgi:hypothetical protein